MAINKAINKFLIKHHQNMKKTKWQKLLNLIESTEIGAVIYRKQVLRCAEKNPNAHLVYSVDSYRRYLTLIKILEDTSQKGCYRVIKHIPEKEFSLNTARKLAYKK